MYYAANFQDIWSFVCDKVDSDDAVSTETTQKLKNSDEAGSKYWTLVGANVLRIRNKMEAVLSKNMGLE